MATGYTPPRYEDIRAAVVAKWKLKYGANADTSSDTVDGLFVDILAEMAQTGYDGIAEFYNQHYIGTASGLNVDALIAPLFGITRLAATKSSCEVWLYGTLGTVIPAISPVSTVDTGAAFETSAIVTIAATTRAVFTFPALSTPTTITITIGGDTTIVSSVSGTAVEVAADVAAALFANSNVVNTYGAGVQPDGQGIVLVEMTAVWAVMTDVGSAWNATAGFATAVDTGPILAAYGTLTRAGIVLAGWAGLVNIIDATVGAREETTGAYKTRHAEAVNGRAFATPRGLAQRLVALLGVGAVKIYQNTAGVEVDGRPSHSFEAVVDGGDQNEIAETIWLCHTTGTQSFGSEVITVYDDQGLVVQPQTIRFSRPNYRYIHMQTTITRGEGFPLLPLTDIQALVSQTIEAWGNTLGIGRDVYIFEIGSKIGAALAGIASLTILIASTATPSGSPSYGASDLTMDDLDYSRWAASRIAVSVI
jgi:hypothetical protein